MLKPLWMYNNWSMMASEDVIELGSSDDDTEPAPKKVSNLI